MTNQSEKKCSKCKDFFPATTDYFNRDKYCHDGLKSYCKICHRAMSSQYKKDNPEKNRAKEKRRRERNPEKVREALKRWRKANPEKVREVVRRWQRAHPEKIRIYNTQRRMREVGLEGVHTAEDEFILIEMQQGLCCYCSELLDDYTVDHIISISRKGSDYPSNLVICCHSCNSSKKESTLFIEWQPRKFLEHMRTHVENALKANR